jgi:hypothetical protein
MPTPLITVETAERIEAAALRAIANLSKPSIEHGPFAYHFDVRMAALAVQDGTDGSQDELWDALEEMRFDCAYQALVTSLYKAERIAA